MRLRNGKATHSYYFLRNALIENIFDVINFINKEKSYQIDNIETSENSIIIENICNIFYMCFTHEVCKNYGVKSCTFECDYRIKKNSIELYKYNKKHICNINTLCNKFLKSLFYEKIKQKILDDYENILNLSNENVKYKMIKIIRFICILSLSYYYFHMVVIETLYNDCLIWKHIRQTFDEFKNDHHYYCDIIPMSKIITYSVSLYNDLILQDNDDCVYVRKFILHL